MKVLSIGNSFSTDSHKWLNKLAAANGLEIETANLFIGGCSLETHWTNVKENNAYYDYELNGNDAKRKISIAQALAAEKWDAITLQQVSNFSGIEETFEPYLTNIVKTVKSAQPDARLYYHQTWAYEIDSSHPGFINYSNDQHKMFDKIKHATEIAAESIGADIIPTGTVIQKLRDCTNEFDYPNGGLSLCRDGFHLSFNYGRFAAAATWLRTLTGKSISITRFEDFDINLLEVIIKTVNEI